MLRSTINNIKYPAKFVCTSCNLEVFAKDCDTTSTRSRKCSYKVRENGTLYCNMCNTNMSHK